MLNKILNIRQTLRSKPLIFREVNQDIYLIYTIQLSKFLMNFRVNSIKFYIFLLTIGSLLSVPAHADAHLTFCYDPYPPYTLGAEGEPEGGLKVKLLRAVVNQIDGLTADVVLLPWKRCQAEARNGAVDGILPLFKNDERETYLTFTHRTFEQTSNFWYSRDRFPDGLAWNGKLGDLSHLRLGMVGGSVIDEDMEKAFAQNYEITRARDANALMQILLKDRVDLVALDGAVGRYTVHKNGWHEQIASLHEPISSKFSYFGLSKKGGADSHLGAFNDAIEELETAGAIEEILLSTDYAQ